MKKTFEALCEYEDGSCDTATVIITSEGDIYQVAWEISNGEKDRMVIEAESHEEAFQIWCDDNGFEPAS
jgi:hypothetical protein